MHRHRRDAAASQDALRKLSPSPASHPGTLARNPPNAPQGASFLRKTRTSRFPFASLSCRLRACALCEEARFAPCTAGGTRARPRITRRWHRATAEKLGGHHGKSGSHHHEGAKDRAVAALERRPRHGCAASQILRASRLPPSEPGLLRLGAHVPSDGELLRWLLVPRHRFLHHGPADGPRRQRRLRHRGLAHRRPPANGVRLGLEPHRDALLRAFRRGRLAQIQRDAPRLRRGDARGLEARRLPRCSRDSHLRGSLGRQGLDARVRIRIQTFRGRRLRR